VSCEEPQLNRQTSIQALLSVVVLASLLLLTTNCSKKKSDPVMAAAPQGTTGMQSQAAGEVLGLRKTWGIHMMDQPGTIFQVEYSDKTSIVDMETVARTFRGVTEDHRIFVFVDSPELRQKLIPGNYVLFEGLDLRKVEALAIDPRTNNLVVGTEKANLREALKKADVEFTVPVDFGDIFGQLVAAQSLPMAERPTVARALTLPSFMDWIQPTVYAGLSNDEIEGEVQFSDSDFANWKTHYHYSRNPDHSLNFNVELEREANGLNVFLNAKGRVNRFIQQASFVMTKEGNMREYFKNGGLHGTVDLDWSVKTSEVKTPKNEVRFKLPGKITIPLTEMTKLPMSVQISTALLFHPAFTGRDQVAKGGFHADFSGDEGVKVDQSGMQADGQGDGSSAITQSFAFAPLSAFGLVMAIAAPRIELRMGSEEIWDLGKIPLPSSFAESLTDVLLKNTIAGKWLDKKVGNPLSIEGAAYFQLVLSTTAAHSGMQSLVPCQQFTTTVEGQLGIDAEWLGNNTNWPPIKMFSKNFVQRQPDSKICGGG
jgi:hypothetical protein